MVKQLVLKFYHLPQWWFHFPANDNFKTEIFLNEIFHFLTIFCNKLISKKNILYTNRCWNLHKFLPRILHKLLDSNQHKLLDSNQHKLLDSNHHKIIHRNPRIKFYIRTDIKFYMETYLTFCIGTNIRFYIEPT